MKLKYYKKRVEHILEKYENARNNDQSLLACYVYEYMPEFVRKDENGDHFVRLKDFKHLPPAQTLVNNRKVIQNTEGKYLPTKEIVRKARRIKASDIKNYEWAEIKHD